MLNSKIHLKFLQWCQSFCLLFNPINQYTAQQGEIILVALWSPKYTIPMKILFLYLSHCEEKGNCCWNYYHLCSSFEGVSQSQEIRNLCILIEPSACLKYKAVWTLRDICHSCFFSPAAVPLSMALSRFTLNSRCRAVHTGCFSSGVQGAEANFTLSSRVIRVCMSLRGKGFSGFALSFHLAVLRVGLLRISLLNQTLHSEC